MSTLWMGSLQIPSCQVKKVSVWTQLPPQTHTQTHTDTHTCLKCVSVCHLPAVLSSLWLFPPSLPSCSFVIFGIIPLSLPSYTLCPLFLSPPSFLHFFIDAVVSPSSSLVLPLLLNHLSLVSSCFFPLFHFSHLGISIFPVALHFTLFIYLIEQ